ncbi:preQ(1) synthase [Candidatus Poriferisodalis sp.]|uniref:preQ(1) synthase n=1 Tax=Candidatus Poriferisodalis sp. TaxID=3101277 RepID=UPI003B023FA6
MASEPSSELIALDDPYPERDYEVRCTTPELTCVCPVTRQPDFATVEIAYLPNRHIVELKSLKLYLWNFRDEPVHHEAVTNRILDDLVAAIAPKQAMVQTRWLVRGGITTTVTARHPAQASLD